MPARNISEVILIHPFIDTDDDGEADVFDEDDDNDGMLDWCEILYGLDPLDPSNADEDADGDGATNPEECLAGTNPNVDEDALLKDSFEDIEPPK